jgi:hypothetical protein
MSLPSVFFGSLVRTPASPQAPRRHIFLATRTSSFQPSWSKSVVSGRQWRKWRRLVLECSLHSGACSSRSNGSSRYSGGSPRFDIERAARGSQAGVGRCCNKAAGGECRGICDQSRSRDRAGAVDRPQWADRSVRREAPATLVHQMTVAGARDRGRSCRPARVPPTRASEVGAPDRSTYGALPPARRCTSSMRSIILGDASVRAPAAISTSMTRA